MLWLFESQIKAFSEKTKDSDIIEGISSRWYTLSKFQSDANPELEVSGLLMILDTKQEVNIGLGRDFSKTLLNLGQGFMTKSSLNYLNIEPNGENVVNVIIDIRQYLVEIFDTNEVLDVEDVNKIMNASFSPIDYSQSFTMSSSDVLDTTGIEGKQSCLFIQ